MLEMDMNKNIRKNQPCPCGSGKKYKECCWNKKPRKQGIVVDMGSPTVINSLTFKPDGTIEFKSNGKKVNPVKAFLRKWYDRKKGDKKLYDIPITPNNLFLDQNRNLDQFDYIYAIDTNSKNFNGEQISVCCAKYNTLTKECYMRGPIVFKNKPSVTEQTNWRELIKDIMKQKEYTLSLKIAVVVDCDYGNVRKYNSNELPIINNFYLPKNFTLIYASTDSGIENLPNKMIYECDKLAKKYLKNYEKNK